MKVAVVGSVNLDLVATVAHLPRAGETVGGASLARHPGGKGANQALAARRLGAEVTLMAAVGTDSLADEALALLRRDGVGLGHLVAVPGQPTGIALIAVDPAGENLIVVVPGANGALAPADLPPLEADALILQLEVPVETVEAAALGFEGFVALNLAPAQAVPAALLARADLLVVNESEHAFYGGALTARPGLTALTLGARGAELWRSGQCIARAAPPPVEVVDAVGAGDTFVAALTVALTEGRAADAALAFACAASALAVTQPGAQPSLPWRAAVDHLLARERT